MRANEPAHAASLRFTAEELTQIEALSTRIAQALINAMEAKSPYLRGHSHRVAAVAAGLASELGFSEEGVEQIRLAGRLHDVGKIGVREDILDKPSALTGAEVAHVREHVRIGLDILAPLDHLGAVLSYIAHHHERVDGSGYPHGLQGEDISLGGQVVGAADVFDALTSPRAYREAMSSADAMAYLAQCGPGVIAPAVLPALTHAVRSGSLLVFLNDQ